MTPLTGVSNGGSKANQTTSSSQKQQNTPPNQLSNSPNKTEVSKPTQSEWIKAGGLFMNEYVFTPLKNLKKVVLTNMANINESMGATFGKHMPSKAYEF